VTQKPNEKGRPPLNRPVRYFALACDYDGTMAHSGVASKSTVEALKKVAASGRKLILVTGRQVDDLRAWFPDVGVFDRVVAENGAILYRPGSGEMKILAPPPPEAFIAALRAQNVSPLAIGASIVATWEPHDAVVLKVIREMGLELQVVYNKGAVMILPSGVNKSTGLLAALLELGISEHNTVAVGDAENDHALLDQCACAVAVENAIPTLKQRADILIQGVNGHGVEELIRRLLADELQGVSSRRDAFRVLLGTGADGEQLFLPDDTNILIAGPSSGGKSTIVHALLEPLLEKNFQVCLVDPEGDYLNAEGILVLGTGARPPDLTEVFGALEKPRTSITINLLGLALEDRPRFVDALLPRLQELRARTGRPHRVIIDEAHHLMPASWKPVADLPDLTGMILVTVHPETLAKEVIRSLGGMIAVGPSPENTIREFGAAAGWAVPRSFPHRESGRTMVWLPRGFPELRSVHVSPPKTEVRRHKRKYASGQLGEDRSFYFRGPQNKLNLQAQNLSMFTQIAKGVDDETWLHHLRGGDYSRWVRDCIKDQELSADIEKIEKNNSLPPQESRQLVIGAINERYTAEEETKVV
jgi:hydroxymethylpyrimidine pyrophosphatase-like HAD family hydrolase